MTKTILVADDNPEIRQTLKDIFIEKGYVVELAEGGFEALACLKEKFIDVIVLDLMMPERSGTQIFDTIKNISPLTGIIIYTGFKQYENSAYAQSANKFILKGSDMDELLLAVEEILA